MTTESPTHLSMPRTLEQMRDQVQYGMPLTMDEQRWLVERVTGRPVPQRKRCVKCGGEGNFGWVESGRRIVCQTCNGSGYQYTVVICDGCNVPSPSEHSCHGKHARVADIDTGRACQCNDEACLAERGEPPSDVPHGKIRNMRPMTELYDGCWGEALMVYRVDRCMDRKELRDALKHRGITLSMAMLDSVERLGAKPSTIERIAGYIASASKMTDEEILDHIVRDATPPLPPEDL